MGIRIYGPLGRLLGMFVGDRIYSDNGRLQGHIYRGPGLGMDLIWSILITAAAYLALVFVALNAVQFLLIQMPREQPYVFLSVVIAVTVLVIQWRGIRKTLKSLNSMNPEEIIIFQAMQRRKRILFLIAAACIALILGGYMHYRSAPHRIPEKSKVRYGLQLFPREKASRLAPVKIHISVAH